MAEGFTVFCVRALAALAPLLLLPALVSAEPRESRAHASSNGVWSIQLVESSPGQCRVEATRDADPAWSVGKCLGSVDDLFFVSNEGDRFWVLTVLPRTPPRPAQTAKQASDKPKPLPPGEPFVQAVVATLFDRQGNLIAERTLRDFLKTRFDKLRDLDRRFCWLEGVVGVPGRRPRISETNQVEFETVDGRTHRLDF